MPWLQILPPLTTAIQASNFTEQKLALTRQKNQVAWGRLASLILGTWLVYTLWSSGTGIALLTGAAFFALFLWLLKRSLVLAEKITLLEQQIAIHNEEQQVLLHHFTDRFNGKALEPKAHTYSGDLDIFGPASLFQYIHRSTSEQGHQMLADWLLKPASNHTITERQEAVKELAGMLEWSVQLQALGQLEPISNRTQSQLQHWIHQPASFKHPFWKILSIGFPIITLGSLLLYLTDLMSAPTFYLLVLLFVIIAFSISKKVVPQYLLLNKIVPQLNTLTASLQFIESAPFKTGLLSALQKELKPAHKASAAVSIRLLRQILDRFDYRINPVVFLPLNTFLLWDLQQVLALEKWKAEREEKISEWFRILGEIEALNSLGRVCFNLPDWNFPSLVDAHGTFIGKQIGHPLIPEGKRISNDFSTSGQPSLALITGSNMAGKSTFLRSIGINQVLAMSGAPVCAAELTVSNMRIMSSMRIADNLEENASTFYAELSKLKSIIEAVNAHEPVYLLLDEILRGTNSQDRHTGSRALMIQLIKQSATGMLATHDLALTDLSNEYPVAIHNYHFDVSVSGEELYFDYKLKPGICKSMNASILMKKIGINL
jgi:hypothetical protein